MPRSFDVSVESPVSVDQVHAALSAEEYWLARIGNLKGSTSLESLVVDDDQTVRVTTTQDLGRDLLPGIVAKFYRRDLKVRHTETWIPSGDQLRGAISCRGVRSAGLGFGCRVGRAHPERFTADLQRDGGIQSSVGRWDRRELYCARIRPGDTGYRGLHRQVGYRAHLTPGRRTSEATTLAANATLVCTKNAKAGPRPLRVYSLTA